MNKLITKMMCMALISVLCMSAFAQNNVRKTNDEFKKETAQEKTACSQAREGFVKSTAYVAGAPVTGLTSKVSNHDVFLSWTAPQGAPTGYEVRMDGNLLATVSTTTYNHPNVAEGDHVYTVRAIFGGEGNPQDVIVHAFVEGEGGGGNVRATNELIFNYTGSVQTLQLTPGTHTIEVWGANGGGGGGADAIKGGYSKGDYTVTSPTTLYVYVGGKGTYVAPNGPAPGGWNGGGASTTFSGAFGSGSGGGGTDVRTTNNATYANRIIVAGGGAGGGGNHNGSGNQYGQAQDRGGYGGGTTGENSPSTSYTAYGGTQTAGGAGASGQPSGTLGVGGSVTGNNTGGGGGGGW